MELGIELPVCRVIVNQAHAFATGGSFTNGLPFSLSMGCGTWGKNSIDDNLNYKHFINITKISTVIPGIEPKLKDFFEEYCNKYHPKELKNYRSMIVKSLKTVKIILNLMSHKNPKIILSFVLIPT